MRIHELKEPIAITMWDTSYIRRRYAGGGFEDYDQVLNELTERGYNAVRIDAFPHMIANAPDGTNSERFIDPSGFGTQTFGFAGWGGPWTVYSYPRRDLVDFIKKCEKRNIYVLLSTWLKPMGEPRNEWVEGPEGLIRIWDETLRFLSDHDCLKNVIGVDVQNEIPLYAGNYWLHKQLDRLKTPGVAWNQQQKDFYYRYFDKVLQGLRERWPGIPFSASMDHVVIFKHRDMDFSQCDFLDMHMWATQADTVDIMSSEAYKAICDMPYNVQCNQKTPNAYIATTRIMPPDINFDQYNEQIHEKWFKNRSRFEEWLEEGIAYVAQKGKQYGIPYGNTEGWGTIFWAEHPLLTWDLIKDAGLMGARLGRKYGYTFNCQSNFCAPQFLSLWRDIDYHREVTSIIRGINE